MGQAVTQDGWLDQDGFITSRQGKGFFVIPSSSNLILEQLMKEVGSNLNNAIQVAQRASMYDEEVRRIKGFTCLQHMANVCYF